MRIDFSLLFIFGISIGSFLNVLIDRLPKNESILGRSRCDRCKKKINWYDLIPLLSFFLLKGRCRHCKTKLSWQYPIIEALTGGTFIYVYMLTSLTNGSQMFFISLMLNLILISGLIVIFMADFKYRIIPDQILLILVAISLFINLLFRPTSFGVNILSGGILFLVFLILYLMTHGRGMGFGDVKYVFFMGFLLGFPYSIVAFYIAFLTGAIISLILIIGGVKKFKQTIAFGPFLVASTFITYFYGDKLWIIFQKIIGMA